MSRNVFGSIRDWASKRGLYAKGNSVTQFVKLQEETGELARAILKRDDKEFYDAVGDACIVMTNLVVLYELEKTELELRKDERPSKMMKLEDCIKLAYSVIENRTGKMENSTFVKDD